MLYEVITVSLGRKTEETGVQDGKITARETVHTVPHGHDGFLLDDALYLAVVGAYYDRIAAELRLAAPEMGSGP